jgi:hypothetical protein
MKRFFLLIVLVMLVSWMVASRRSAFIRPAGPTRHWDGPTYVHHGDRGRRPADDSRQHTRRVLAEARRALAEARDEVRSAFDEARDDVRQAFDDVRVSLDSDDDAPRRPKPARAAKPTAKVEVDGLPVPIVPGTRVTNAEPRPPAPPVPPAPAVLPTSAAVASTATATVTGQLSATEERAKADAGRQLRHDVAEWLEPEVPGSWTPTGRLLDVMVSSTHVKTIEKDYGTLYEATLTVDKSPERRSALIEVYNRQLVEQRMATLGGTLAFILICLAAVSGYIRADEATKGYYTNRLRMLAAAGVGAAGVILYHMVA